jgi:hypothetical protein
MAKSCKGLAMELVKCLSETDCVKVGRLLPPPSSLSPRPPTAQSSAACFYPIGCGRDPIRCKLVRGERIREP